MPDLRRGSFTPASTATLARDCRLRSIGQHTRAKVHGHAVWEYLHKVGFDQHEVHSSSGTAIVFASHTALQLREIVFGRSSSPRLAAGSFFILFPFGWRRWTSANNPSALGAFAVGNKHHMPFHCTANRDLPESHLTSGPGLETRSLRDGVRHSPPLRRLADAS